MEAAAAEFQANGYAATNMGTVAQRAGVSTKTLYRLVPTKADLFENVVKDRIRRFMLAIDDEIVGGPDLAAGLERMLFAFGSLTLSAEVIAMNRLVIGECDRFPEIAKTFYLSAIVPVNGMIEGWLQRQADQGRLRIDDIRIASGILRGMMIMEPQRVAMLRQRKPRTKRKSPAGRKSARGFSWRGAGSDSRADPDDADRGHPTGTLKRVCNPVTKGPEPEQSPVGERLSEKSARNFARGTQMGFSGGSPSLCLRMAGLDLGNPRRVHRRGANDHR